MILDISYFEEFKCCILAADGNKYTTQNYKYLNVLCETSNKICCNLVGDVANPLCQFYSTWRPIWPVL